MFTVDVKQPIKQTNHRLSIFFIAPQRDSNLCYLYYLASETYPGRHIIARATDRAEEMGFCILALLLHIYKVVFTVIWLEKVLFLASSAICIRLSALPRVRSTLTRRY